MNNYPVILGIISEAMKQGSILTNQYNEMSPGFWWHMGGVPQESLTNYHTSCIFLKPVNLPSNYPVNLHQEATR